MHWALQMSCLTGVRALGSTNELPYGGSQRLSLLRVFPYQADCCRLAHVSVRTLWRLGANILAGTCLSTRSGGSAHCLHSRAFYRKRTLMNAPSNSVCFQFRLMMLLWSVCIVHTFWRLNALFAARANGGYSCPQALEETQADIVAFCRE